MKKLALISTLLLSLGLFASFTYYGEVIEADDAVGIWLSENKKEKVQIYKRGNKYYGKMLWMENEFDENGNRQLDKNNPDPNLRNQPMVGVEFVTGFTYAGNGYYTGGYIYDMGSGNSYRGRIYMPNKQTAEMRGYIGIPLFGRTEICTKINE